MFGFVISSFLKHTPDILTFITFQHKQLNISPLSMVASGKKKNEMACQIKMPSFYS